MLNALIAGLALSLASISAEAQTKPAVVQSDTALAAALARADGPARIDRAQMSVDSIFYDSYRTMSAVEAARALAGRTVTFQNNALRIVGPPKSDSIMMELGAMRQKTVIEQQGVLAESDTGKKKAEPTKKIPVKKDATAGAPAPKPAAAHATATAEAKSGGVTAKAVAETPSGTATASVNTGCTGNVISCHKLATAGVVIATIGLGIWANKQGWFNPPKQTQTTSTTVINTFDRGVAIGGRIPIGF